MKILLIAGQLHDILFPFIKQEFNIVNEEKVWLQTAVQYLDLTKKSFDAVLITDDGLSGLNYQVGTKLLDFLEYNRINISHDCHTLIVTRDFMLNDMLTSLGDTQSLRIHVDDYMRTPVHIYTEAINSMKGYGTPKKAPDIKYSLSPEEGNEGKRRFSFFERFRQKTVADEEEIRATDDMTKKFERISHSISRVVAVTGHRGSGLTSTAVNMGYLAQKRGLSTIVIDMDLDYRSTNMYFGTFHEKAQEDEELAASLVRCLARPQDYITQAFNVRDNFWLTTLSYSFNDKRLVEQFYTCNKFISMISVLRQKFNLVIVDMPMDLLSTFSNALIHIDVFALCIPNNLYAVLSTLRNASVVLDKENLAYLNAKSKVVVTKYNDKARLQQELFTPDRVCQVLASDLSDSFNLEMPLAGYVPYSSDFDKQIETDVPIATENAHFEKAYGNLLLRLMEGA